MTPAEDFGIQMVSVAWGLENEQKSRSAGILYCDSDEAGRLPRCPFLRRRALQWLSPARVKDMSLSELMRHRRTLS